MICPDIDIQTVDPFKEDKILCFFRYRHCFFNSFRRFFAVFFQNDFFRLFGFRFNDDFFRCFLFRCYGFFFFIYSREVSGSVCHKTDDLFLFCIYSNNLMFFSIQQLCFIFSRRCFFDQEQLRGSFVFSQFSFNLEVQTALRQYFIF